MDTKKVIRINSRLYYDLFSHENGGDRLIAFYCILKASRKNDSRFRAFISKNNKLVSGYGLLRAETNLSLSTIEKYMPILIEKGLCTMEDNGDITLLGNNKTKELYSCDKLVPIIIEENLVKTSLQATAVRVKSAEDKQKHQISGKTRQSELICQTKNPKNLKDYKKGLELLKNNPEGIKVEKEVVLSNIGFDSLKLGGTQTEKENRVHSKSKGAYWKKRLKEIGIISSQRRFKLVEAMPHSQYLLQKKYGELSRIHTYSKGFLVIELISSFSFLGHNC